MVFLKYWYHCCRFEPRILCWILKIKSARCLWSYKMTNISLRAVLLPSICGLLAAVLWGAWMPVTKYAIINSLDVVDIVFLRFATSSIIAIPLLLKFGFVIRQKQALAKILVLTIGSGIGYVIVASFGFVFLSASYGSIIPISMTFFSIIAGFFLYSNKLTAKMILCFVCILTGFLLFLNEITKNTESNLSVFPGVLLFIASGFFFATYNVCMKKWSIQPLHSVSLVSFYSFLLFFPIYLFFLEKKYSSQTR